MLFCYDYSDGKKIAMAVEGTSSTRICKIIINDDARLLRHAPRHKKRDCTVAAESERLSASFVLLSPKYSSVLFVLKISAGLGTTSEYLRQEPFLD
jgi:hypothetical protein